MVVYTSLFFLKFRKVWKKSNFLSKITKNLVKMQHFEHLFVKKKHYIAYDRNIHGLYEI